MSGVATVVAVFGTVLVIGLVLRRWSQRHVEERLGENEHYGADTRDLADPSRWPAPPPTGEATDGPGHDERSPDEQGPASDY